MAVGEGSSEPDDDETLPSQHDGPPDIRPKAQDEDEEDDDNEEEEPRLKYANLTKNLTGLYRGGDAASAFFVTADKLFIATHNGNIHVLTMPALDSLKVYTAHTASISSISISPYPPPLPSLKLDAAQRLASEAAQESQRSPTSSPAGRNSPRQAQPPVPPTPSNQIYIATSSIDGNVCVASLIDPKDVQLRNFGRPVQAVALSPQYKSDRNYLSGGQAGSLILTHGGVTGKSANATTTGAAAAASGWLGSIGLAADTGTDRVLHSGEGIISTIKWSLSGKYVLWVNEHGIKIMRSDLHLDSGEAGLEWKRIGHIDRPTRSNWEEMSGVWKARAEWINRDNLETDDDAAEAIPGSANGMAAKVERADSESNVQEEVLVGWGDTIWLIRVSLDSDTGGKASAKKTSHAEVATIIRFDDCTISGVSLYTPKLLLVLAYMEKKQSTKSASGTDAGKKGRRQRINALEPELRLIDINTKEEIDTDTLTISRYETLASSDYHVGVLPPTRIPASLAQRGYLGQLGSGVSAIGSGIYSGVETVGQGMWDATLYAPRKLGAGRIFSGADSVRSAGTGPEKPVATRDKNYLTGWLPGFGSSTAQQDDEVKDVAQTLGMKIFIFSPYDCIVAVKRNLADRLRWLLSIEKYKEAWELLDIHPAAAGASTDASGTSSPPTPSKASSIARSSSLAVPTSSSMKQQATLAEFFADSASLTSSVKGKDRDKFSAAEKEKRRIGELWLKQLVADKNWTEAGEVAGKVLNTSTRWEHWVWVFIKNKKFDEISSYIPTLDLTPPLPSLVFEIVLGHYVSTDRRRFKELLDQWPSDIFEISSITTAIEDQLKSDSISEGSDDWRILVESLAKLFLADGNYDGALKCYIRLQDADTALSLIKDHHLIESILDDIPSFVQLRVSDTHLKSAPTDELYDLASEPIKLLVDEAETGLIQPEEVVEQLEAASLTRFLFFYLRALWRGEGTKQEKRAPRVGHLAAMETITADAGKILVENFADTAVDLFAEFDRDLLNDFLHTSIAYTFEKAVAVCEKKHYIPELVYLLSKTGQMKKALFLIIDELHDVSKAIEFAREQDDKDLWDDFLDYSMSRPRFISGLLAEVGMAIDPITLIKRIPLGLEIEGLKDGLKKMLREYDLQNSISTGAVQVFSSEVAVGLDTLRRGRRKGVKFDIAQHRSHKNRPKDVDPSASTELVQDHEQHDPVTEVEPGHCASCHKAFHQDEKDTLVGFACGHIYHLQHLLHGPPADDEESTAGADEEDEEATSTFTKTVGPKVTNARLLKDKIEGAGGCVVCRERREKLEEVQ
jgi:vacuolar protein sorting-associated protein 41